MNSTVCWITPGCKMDPIVKQIVDRCHIAESYSKVLRYMIGCMQGGKNCWRLLDRKTRRRIIADMIKVHDENRKLFNFVMRGR